MTASAARTWTNRWGGIPPPAGDEFGMLPGMGCGGLGLGAWPLVPSSLLSPRWENNGGIAMTMAGGGLGLGFSGDSYQRQPPAS